jgi:RimJ/RimL family protein N-acetyltransferase
MLPSARFGGATLVIELADGTAAGVVSYIRVPYGPNERSLAYRIEITVLPAHRRRGVGAAAQRLLADQLLSQSGSNPVEADTDVGNIAEQRTLERAGFTREGVVRGAQWRWGAWHDRVLYGPACGPTPDRARAGRPSYRSLTIVSESGSPRSTIR